MTLRQIHNLAFSMMLTAVPFLALNSCQENDEPVPVPVQTTIPIALSASADSADQTKTLIAADNITLFPFSVWADRTYKESNEKVFSGDKVWCENDDWRYSGTKYWQLGTYNFAAVMPSLDALGDGTAPSGSYNGTALTLGFSASSPFTLGGVTSETIATQIDLMTAFPATVNFEDIDTPPGAVSISFNHLLSLLDIKITTDDASKAFEVSGIKIYGLYKSLKNNVTLTSGDTEDNLSSIRAAMADASTADYPYCTSAAAVKVEGEAIAIENLIVFPENISDDHPLYVSITYGSDDKVSTVKIPSGDWTSGNKYTYTLDVDAVKIGDPVVTPWPTDYTPTPEVEIK